jgi:hypothetical protein
VKSVEHVRVGAAVLSLLAGSGASGCTVCASELAQQVRERLFAADFFANLAVLFAPMALLFTVIAIDHWRRS